MAEESTESGLAGQISFTRSTLITKRTESLKSEIRYQKTYHDSPSSKYPDAPQFSQ